MGIARLAPAWLNRERTLAKVVKYMHQAAHAGCRLVAFGEALLPQYSFWIGASDGACSNVGGPLKTGNRFFYHGD